MKVVLIQFFNRDRGSCGYIDVIVYTQVSAPVVSSLGTRLDGDCTWF